MIALALVAALLIAAIACIIALVLRHRFVKHLDTLEAELRKPVSTSTMRSDLPAEVIALASRLGAQADGAAGFATFSQTGQMWKTPGGKPISFTARQTMRTDQPGFMWRADLTPAILVTDYFVAGTGGLEVRLLGVAPVAHIVGGAAVNQGEVLRYLAELPWCPDAILVNRALDWTVIDAKTIKVATGIGTERGEVTFALDDDGLIVRARALSRAYTEKDGQMTAHPWHGRFWDYQRLDGRFIPMQGEVAWTLDAGDFVYWRGRILKWSA